MKRIFGFLFILIVYSANIQAQIGVGEWRDHLSFNYSFIVTESPTKIYTASENGIFTYNKQSHNIEKITKVNGLSDIGISAMNYSDNNKVLVVGYSNGNIDLLYNNELYNLSDIKRETMNGSKAINHILLLDEYAYLSCGFGVVVLNLQKREIKDTYFIGDLGTQLKVNQMAYDGDYLYAATDQGIYVANYTNSNLIDYSNWDKITTIPNPFNEFNKIDVFEGNILANQHNESSNDILYIYRQVVWNILSSEYSSIRNIKHNNSIEVVTNRNILIYNPDVVFQDSISRTEINDLSPNDVLLDDAGIYWIANSGSGLIKYQNGNTERILPNGPYTANAFSIDADKNKVLVVAGGTNLSWNNTFLNGSLFSFKDEQWTSKINYNVADYVVVKIDPYNSDHYFVGSWGKGVLEFKNDEIETIYNGSNSSLQTMIAGEDYYRIAGLAFDSDNNLWVTNFGVTKPISVRKNSDREWHSFSHDEVIRNFAVSDIIVTQNNQKWVILPDGNGLFVFDDNKTIDNEKDDLYKKLNIIDENGKIITNFVYSIAEDLDGNIWVGTNMGILVYYNPENVFEDASFHTQRISLTIGDLTQYLLNTELVTAIAVDGANRKWLGTQSSGVYLVSKDGTEEIEHFTEENSPLLSNRINDIGINNESGEVFFATDKGLVSYGGSATQGSDEFRNVYVYPNPVRENYYGDVTIRGLVSDVNVKITDISGNIVYETKAEGGQATWGGKNFSGRRVSTGVYLVFCTNDDGSKTYITKLLFIK